MGSSFSMEGGGMSPEKRCAICIEDGPKEIVNNEGQVEQVQQVQICPTGHYAHLSCITYWYAISDICPECRNKVRDFPLWQDINPPEPETEPVNPGAPAPVVPLEERNPPPGIPVLPGAPPYVVPLPGTHILRDFNNMNEEDDELYDHYTHYDLTDFEVLTRVHENFATIRRENNYNTASNYFDSPEGYAYVLYSIDQDMRNYEYEINEEDEDPENVDVNSLMYSLLRQGQMNVAQALYDSASFHNLLEDLIEYSGAIINKYVRRFHHHRDTVSWLWYRGFNVGFRFLENAALEARNAEAVQWYLEHVQPSIDDENLMELFDNLRDYREDEDYNMTDEQNEIYALLDRYLNTDMQVQQSQGSVQQTGGMWQRGGFFMTCS